MELWMPAFFNDRMVLQRRAPIRIFGSDQPYQKICVKFDGERLCTRADENGNWEVTVAPKEAAVDLEMEITGSGEIIFRDVCIGDVFLLSGQSNMELPVRRVREQYEKELEEEECPYIRQFAVPQEPDYQGKDRPVSKGRWLSAVSEEKDAFSAVGYFFAVEVRRKYKIPVGLLFAAVGGTTIQAWMGEEELLRISPEYGPILEELKEDGRPAMIEAHNVSAAAVWEEKLQVQDTVRKEWSRRMLLDWKKFTVPAKLSEAEELRDFCGSVWFWKEIQLSDEQAGSSALLSLGTLVDADTAYVNGKKVGETGYQYPPRRYPIPAGVLRKGKNELLLCLKVTSGQGEWIQDKPYCLVLKDEKGQKSVIPLAGEWRFRIGCRLEPAPVQRRIVREPCGLYNGMIYPLRKLEFCAVLWYQGESNTEKEDRPEYYELYLRALLSEWRTLFQKPKLPFVIIQLANYRKPSEYEKDSAWAIIREAQRQVSQMSGT